MSLDARVYLLFAMERLRAAGHLYAWGGESPSEGGFDCSGSISVALMQTARVQEWAALYQGGRSTARGLDSYYAMRGCPEVRAVEDLQPGMLVFYYKSAGAVYHVALHATTIPNMLIEGRSVEVGPVAIESGGSGSAATTPRQALIDSAGLRFSASDRHGSARWHARDPFRLLD